MSTLNDLPARKLRLAIVGMGERATHMARMVCRADANVRVTAVVDLLGDAAIERAVTAELPDAKEIGLFSDIQTLLDHRDEFDGVMIGTPCNLHAACAVQLSGAGLPIFLEKPVAITWDQHNSLAAAFPRDESSVVISFPLRLTAHVKTAVEILRSGRLGTVNQIQAVNNVSYGGVYFGQWYRDYKKAGGLWLQKATHDFDYINCLMEACDPLATPITIAAMHSRTVYGGEMPADLHCSTCDRVEECPESPQNLTRRGNDGGILNYTIPGPDSDHACAFSTSIRNQDAGSALIMYSNGAHASYSQNFITRAGAGSRGATITGYHATLQFHWETDHLTLFDHFTGNVERIPVQVQGNHGGGDAELARNFVNVMRGSDVSHSTLEQGLLSAAMCLSARDAAHLGVNQIIPNTRRPAGDVQVHPRGPIEPPGSRVSLSTGSPYRKNIRPDIKRPSDGRVSEVLPIFPGIK